MPSAPVGSSVPTSRGGDNRDFDLRQSGKEHWIALGMGRLGTNQVSGVVLGRTYDGIASFLGERYDASNRSIAQSAFTIDTISKNQRCS